MQVIVFRSRLRPDIHDAFGRHADDIHAKAVEMPGFVSSKDYTADDGERLTIVEWDNAANLMAWRNEPSHAAAQSAGRDRYYSEYKIQVCTVERHSTFDGTSWNRHGGLRGVAERWLAFFNNRDLDGLLSLYADDATHTSPKIRVRHPETGGLLHGKAQLRAWWQDSFDRLPSLRYEPTKLTADGDRVFMEYIRHLDGEADMPIAEVLECKDGLIVASRVFHG